jgi:hypothetical protein
VLARASFLRVNMYFSRVAIFFSLAIQANSLKAAKGIYTQLNSPSLLEAFPTINFGSPPRSWWIVGAYRYWTMEDPGATVPIAAMVLTLMPPIT